MANLVQLKRSSVANKIPDAANVAVGEPVVNLVDKILYTKNGSNAIVVIGAGTTSNIAEGINLYYTESRANTAIDNRVTKSFVDALNVDADTLDGIQASSFALTSDLTTANVTEVTNLYYTVARANTAIDNRVTKTYIDNLSIDADTLDGIDSASFLRSDADDASNGQLTIGNSSAYDNQGKLVVYGTGRNSLIIQTPDNAQPRGIAFRNVGGAYVSTIYVENAGSNKANLVFGVDNDFETSVNNVIDRLKLTYDGQILFEGNTVWHAGNDGSGSGLDADTLDGIQAASFALSTDLTTANVTETTNLYYTNARVRSAFTAGDGIILESNGQIVANVTTATTFNSSLTSSPTEIFSFDKTVYRGGKALITLNDSPNFKIEELLFIHDGANVTINRPFQSAYFQQDYVQGSYIGFDLEATIGNFSVIYSANIIGDTVYVYGRAEIGSPTAKGSINYISI